MKSMDKAIKQLPLLLVLLYLLFKAGHLELIVFPRDTEVLANYSTYFNCSTSIRNEQIHWYHYRVGENRTNYVYYKRQFNNMYSERYSIKINTETGEYNLIISSVQSMDAGRYECQDDGGLGQQRSAQLIVLDSTPICLSSMRPEGLIGPNSCGLPVEKLHLSCSVSYIGNIPPILQWKVEGNDTPISKAIVSDYPGKSITTNLTLSSGVELDGVVFTCGSTRSHNKEHHCKTNPVIIKYAVDETSVLNITKGETITCSANANVPCLYRWFYGNNAICPVSCNQVLTTTRLDEHSCEASCTINGTGCTFVAMRIVVFENETSTASEDTTTPPLLAALIPTAVVILVTICVVFIIMARLRKVTVAKDALQAENQELLKTILLSRVQQHRETGTADEAKDDGTQQNKGTSEGNRIEMQPLLAGRLQKETGGVDIVQTRLNDGEIITKASKQMGRAIAGVAVLEDLIYVVSDRSSEVETFDTETLDSKQLYTLKELEDPWDLASCRIKNWLYIMDRSYGSKPKYVTCVNSAVKTLARWSTGQEYGSLSVTRDERVVVTLCDSGSLSIYGSDGTRMNVVQLSVDVIHPSHAIELSNGQFLISCGLNEDNIHKVCVLNENFEIVKNTFEGLEIGLPSYMAVDPAGFILVADQGNSRVCKFNTELELIEEVASKRNGLRSPQRICLDVRSGRLYVVDNEVLEFKRRNGKLVIFDYILKCF